MVSVRGMTEHFNAEQVAGAFFATYAEALLRRDADAIAEHYATPALIEFPQAASPVSEVRAAPTVRRVACFTMHLP